MKATVFKIVSLVLLAGVCVGAITVLKLDNQRRRSRLPDLAARREQVVRLGADNRRTQEILDRAKVDKSDGDRAIHAELAKSRAEIVELESRAQANRARSLEQDAARSRALDDNRDPERGPTKLEFLKNAGRQTPAAGFQTLAWAVLKGDDDVLAASIAIDGSVRQSAEYFIAGLPADLREKYPTPEKLAELFLAKPILESASFQILDQTASDPQHVTLNIRFRVNASDRDFPLPIQLGAAGWQVVIGEKQMQSIGARFGRPVGPSKN